MENPEKSKDSILENFSRAVNSTNAIAPVTIYLIVGGTIIKGTIIPEHQYFGLSSGFFKSSGYTEASEFFDRKLQESKQFYSTADENTHTEYIHLGDAQLIQNGMIMMTLKYLRLRLSEIGGFSFE